MIKRSVFRAAAVLTAILVVLGTTLPASAGDGLPFKGDAEVAIVGAVPDGNDLRLTVTGTGEATYLGRFSRVENLTVHSDGTVDGDLTFMAADGDLLIADVAGGFTSPPNVLPVTAEGICTFTDGSGRFSDAEGSYEFAAISYDGVHFSIVFEGTISF